LVPFDMGRADLKRDVQTYAREEERGGLRYAFRNPRSPETHMTAVEAWEHFQAAGESPLSRWQSHLLVWKS
ncbi:MAG: methyltransferase, partial [Chloroflexi bacterium]|nr:methyltransferase [Chloroflexota bacterium]